MDKQFLGKIEEMFPLPDKSGKRENVGEQGQNDLKAVTLSIMDSIPHAVFGLKDRRIIFANHAVESVFGWKTEELIGKSIRVLYRSDEEYEEIAGYAHQALEKQRTYIREFHYRHKDGRDIVCLVSSSRVGKILKDGMIVVTYSDITEQKRAEESLRLVDVYNRTLLETCLDPLVVIDTAGKISDVNAATEKVTGYLREELIGTYFSNYFTDPESARAGYWKVFKERTIYNYPLEIRHRDGRVTPVLYNASVYRDECDNVVSIFAVARDITERKHMMEPTYDNGDEIISTAGLTRKITTCEWAEEELKKREREMEAKSRDLEEANIALKVFLRQREEDKSDLEEKVLSNVKELIEPHVEKLKKTRLTVEQIACVSSIETHLKDIIAPFLRNLTSKYLCLTPREIQIANLIKEGKTSKEIAQLLHLSQGAIDFHRNNVRNKLGLKKKKTNLRSYLLSLS